jgi:peptide/nickel transport system substrate-binding protein
MKRTSLAVALTATLVASAACGGSGGKSGENTKKAEKFSVVVGDGAASTGPATAPEGARQGGTAFVLEQSAIPHLDPAEVYTSTAQATSMLFTRQLTSYRKVNGQWTLVGDLATDPGSTSDGGKTWKFTLKEGVKFDDGTPVTSEDVKYGVERTYDSGKVLGPKWIPQWLSGSDYAKAYEGPGKGESLPDDVVETPDDRTVVFHLREAHADFPFAVAMPYSSPVQKSRDGKSYDNKPSATGPYKIEKHDDTKLTLVRNEQWDPATDPIRTAYPGRYEFAYGSEATQIAQRLISDNGDDKNAVTLNTGIPSQFAQQVMGQADLKARMLSALNPYSYFYAINTSRVTDLNVRKALITAFPKQQVRQVAGGPLAGDLATTILSPTVQGQDPFDLYKVPATGDPEAAKKLLNGKTPTIVFAYQQTETNERSAVVITQALEKADFKVVRKPISAETWYDQLNKKDNGLDLYLAGWAADWPGGSGVIPAIFDGRTIADGTYNYARLDDPEINAEIDRIGKMPNLVEQNKQWAALDKKIMEKAAVVPYLYERSNRLHGSGVGGAAIDIFGQTSLATLFLKS